MLINNCMCCFIQAVPQLCQHIMSTRNTCILQRQSPSYARVHNLHEIHFPVQKLANRNHHILHDSTDTLKYANSTHSLHNARGIGPVIEGKLLFSHILHVSHYLLNGVIFKYMWSSYKTRLPLNQWFEQIFCMGNTMYSSKMSTT